MDRQEMIATNKSLRIIKNELENLLEKGVINDHVFDTISRQLPAESSLSSAATPAIRAAASPVPNAEPYKAPVRAMSNLSLGQEAPASHAPPSYQQVGPPALPSRNGPPPPPPTKPVISHTRALYKYTAADGRDLSFERDDKIAVHEYMNDDWWMGRNLRTGAEGIFPKNYVVIDHGEKAGAYGLGQPQYAAAPAGTVQAYPSAPVQQNPYNAPVPPMAVAEGSGAQQEDQANGKTGQMGKKFGKKLGNAAIFGAGATLGGNLVNSIF